MEIMVLLVLGVIGFLVWQFMESQRAVDTMSIRSRHDRQRTIEVITSAFGGARSLLWTNANGPGLINMRRRGKDGGITMSIDVEELPGGGSKVDMWASQTNVYLFVLVNFAGVVNRRKKAIQRLLEA